MGSADTHAKKRQLLRKKLTQQGMTPDKIDEIITKVGKRQAQQRADEANHRALETAEQRCAEENRRLGIDPEADEAQRRIDEFYEEERQRFDDAKFKPKQVDSVLTGVARATGASAVAVKRRKTMTQYEYRQRDTR